jgi:acyl carrier protein
MVEELKLERIYAQRGIELITPRAGARILDRLINQKTPTVTAITADWGRARQMGLAGQLPPMFSELEVLEPSLADGEAGSSILDVLAETPEEGRLDVVTEQVRRSVAAIFDCAVADVEVDETLDDVGLDSLMAMEFRMRINAMFAIDIPVLEILKGVSVNSLAVRVLGDLDLPRAGEVSAPPADAPDPPADVEQLVAGLSDDELRELLAELEADGS